MVMEIKRIVNKNAQLDGDWKTIKNPKYFQTYFYLLIGCLMANFVPFSKKQPHPTNVNHRVLPIFDPRVSGSLIKRLGTRIRPST